MEQDTKLLLALKRGDSSAVQKWFSSYESRLNRYVLTRISNPKDAEEIVQETFLNALRQLPLFRGSSSLYSWMISIAKHEIADFYRKKYAKKAIKTIPIAELLLNPKREDSEVVAEEVAGVLKQMGAETVELLLQKYVDGKRTSQLAIEYNKTQKAIESDLYRARKEFRERFRAQKELEDT